MPPSMPSDFFKCCADKPYAKGMCRSHYERDLKFRNPNFAQRQRDNTRNWIDQHYERKQELDRAYRKRKKAEKDAL